MNIKYKSIFFVSLFLIIFTYFVNINRSYAYVWENVGAAGLSSGDVYDTTIKLDSNNMPYVAYSDNSISGKVTVKKFNGFSWATIGTEGFSSNPASSIRIFLYRDNPYVIYRDGNASGAKANVMRYTDVTGWYSAGNAGFSAGKAYYPSLYVYDDGTATGTLYAGYSDDTQGLKLTVKKLVDNVWTGPAGFISGGSIFVSLAVNQLGIPYVAYQDLGIGQNNKITVIKSTGPTSWELVGVHGLSAGKAEYISLVIDSNNIPYVAYKDFVNSSKATVMKFNGTSWELVGTAGFSAGQADYVSLAIDSNNVPYVSYKDVANSNKATVMKFNGTSWELVGTAGFSAGQADYVSLAIDSNNVPYVVYRDAVNSGKTTVMKYDFVPPIISGLSSTIIPVKSKTWEWSSDDVTASYRYSIDQDILGVPSGEYSTTTVSAVQSNGTGVYYLHVQAMDTSGNESEVITVSAVLDNTSPVITIIGDNPKTIEYGSLYTDLGATADDETDGDITYNIGIIDPVDTLRLGSYNVVYEVTDSAGNISSSTRVVNVIDTLAPVITILGDNPKISNQYDEYEDEGAEAFDNVDGDISLNIKITNNVNTNILGSYNIVYEVSDLSGNVASSTRIVDVIDIVPPTIIGLVPDDTPKRSKIWSWSSDDESAVYRYHVTSSDAFVFTDEEYSKSASAIQSKMDGHENNNAKDLLNGDEYSPTATSASLSDGNGTYYLHVQAKDENNNISAVAVSAVLDNTSPVITLLGNENNSIYKGQPYTEYGAIVTDNIDSNIVATISGGVDINFIGDYNIVYSAIDTAGNIANSVTRIVSVKDRPSGSSIPMLQPLPLVVSSFNFPMTISSSQQGTINTDLGNGVSINLSVPLGAVNTKTTFEILKTNISTMGMPKLKPFLNKVFDLKAIEDVKKIRNPYFIKPVMITEKLPDGMIDKDLNPYIFQEDLDEWVLIPGAVIDTVSNTISYNINRGGYIALFKSNEKKLALGEKIVNNTSCDKELFKRYLYIGSKGQDVKRLQEILKKLGYFKYDIITNYFGSYTKQAVIEYQKANNLKPYPGWVGPGTRKLLNIENCLSNY